MASDISRHYGDRPLTIVGVMTGSVILLADLIRQLEMPLRVGLVQASSYHGAVRGQLQINPEWIPEVKGREVLLIDDIFDTGHTLVEVLSQMRRLQPQSLRSAVLLRKQARCEVDIEPDFVAFEIPDKFVVGYGLDYHDEYRNLPYLAALAESEAGCDGPGS
jgi:hypoxanthine phosphoribosyltransferase